MNDSFGARDSRETTLSPEELGARLCAEQKEVNDLLDKLGEASRICSVGYSKRWVEAAIVALSKLAPRIINLEDLFRSIDRERHAEGFQHSIDILESLNEIRESCRDLSRLQGTEQSNLLRLTYEANRKRIENVRQTFDQLLENLPYGDGLPEVATEMPSVEMDLSGIVPDEDADFARTRAKVLRLLSRLEMR